MDNVTSGEKENITVSCSFRYRPQVDAVKKTPTPPYQGNIPRVSRLMALAIRFEKLLRDRVVEDRTELARLSLVSKPRITQIMSFLYLSPSIIDDLLHLPATVQGRDRFAERDMRPICAKILWEEQEQLWRDLNREKCPAK